MRGLPRLLVLSILGLLLIGAQAHAYVPQTITVDGVNDFNPANTVDNDTGDTQTGCTPVVLPMDIGKVFMTNDNSFLYIGIEFAKTCYNDMNLGLALDVGGTAVGGASDPFGRKIGWNTIATKPEFVVYDVVPTSANTFNYEALYKWNTGTSVWDNISTQVNPGYGTGTNGLGIVDSVLFKEMKIPLSVLGAAAGTPIGLEVWVTQEGATKGPLDAMCSDAAQLSTPTSTKYDTTGVVEMTCMGPYTVLAVTDVTPPTVAAASVVSFPLLPNRQFGLSSNKIDVTFNEPVDLTTAQTAANYTVSGAAAPLVLLAQRDVAVPSVVHLTVASSMSANAAFYTVTVKNVKDQSNNAIVQNGTTNVASYFIQNLVFQGNMKVGLCKGIFAQADSFAVEGNLAPLTFTMLDNALMTDPEADSIYTVTVPFALPKIGATAEAELAWKFSRKQLAPGTTQEFEPLSGNRAYHISSANGASVTLAGFWNNDDPANFTTHPIDVIFKVDATRFGAGPASVITLLGSESPLTFTQPGVTMRDDGVSPDVTANDKVYTAVVRFPVCASKSIGWKVDFNGVFECATQGNRSFTLNDATNDIVGSPHGPLTLPARSIDRCDVTDHAVKVIYKVNMKGATPVPTPGDSVAVMGGQLPLDFNTPPTALKLMADDGVSPDLVTDKIYTKAITYPDSTPLAITYKYWYNKQGTNNGFECEGFGDRSFTLNDVAYSVATPFVHTLDIFNSCANPLVDVGPNGEFPALLDFASLGQNYPNPSFAASTIRFQLKQAGRVALRVYDVSGRHVATLIDGELQGGSHDARWNGRDNAGRALSNGVYLYELSQGGQRISKRMILLQR